MRLLLHSICREHTVIRAPVMAVVELLKDYTKRHLWETSVNKVIELEKLSSDTSVLYTELNSFVRCLEI
jgi:hypothetical protein